MLEDDRETGHFVTLHQIFQGSVSGLPAEQIRHGVRFEVPPAYLEEAEEILRAADFSSIGTNDLVQYLLAAALGHAACRASHEVLFLRADHLFQLLHHSRADHSTEKVLRSLLAPDMLIVD